MSIFYCQTENMSRSKGDTATAAAAYRAGQTIVDERTGKINRFRRYGVLETFLFNNAGLSRSELWNLAEKSEKASNARVAREWQLALPHELMRDAHQRIISEFSTHLITEYGAAIDVCVHAPGKKGDHRNIHAHLLMTTRSMQPNGTLSEAKIKLNWSDDRLRKNGLPTGSQQISKIRKTWADIVNEELKKAGLDIRISELSLKEQGITHKIPQIHVGKIHTQLARMGYIDRATRWQANELIKQANNIINIGSTHQDVRSLKMKKAAINTELLPHHGGVASSQEEAEKAQNLPIKKLQKQELAEYWKPVEIDPNKGRVINMFRVDDTGIYRWGAGKLKGEEAFRDTGKAIYSQSISEWALAAELELAQGKLRKGEWKEIRAFGDDEYRRRIWAQGQMMGIEVQGYKPTPEELEKYKQKLPENGLASDIKSAPEKQDKAHEKTNRFNNTKDFQSDNGEQQARRNSDNSKSPNI